MIKKPLIADGRRGPRLRAAAALHVLRLLLKSRRIARHCIAKTSPGVRARNENIS